MARMSYLGKPPAKKTSPATLTIKEIDEKTHRRGEPARCCCAEQAGCPSRSEGLRGPARASGFLSGNCLVASKSSARAVRENEGKYLVSPSFCLGERGAFSQPVEPSRARAESAPTVDSAWL